jgi:probable addiction module antidote protein
MSGRSRSYKDGLYRRLQNNSEAINYLQAALEDSQAAFLVALKNVLEARNVAAVARRSQVDRVHLYRMLSSGGNPTLNSLERILHALGMRLAIGPEKEKVRKSSSEPLSRDAWYVTRASQPRMPVYRTATRSTGHVHVEEPGIIGCDYTLSASEETQHLGVPHPACFRESEELYEMAS